MYERTCILYRQPDQVAKLLAAPHQDLCTCPPPQIKRNRKTGIPINHKPPETKPQPHICKTCQGMQINHLYATKAQLDPPGIACKFCGADTPQHLGVGYSPLYDHTFICGPCTIACLCKYNPARLRFNQYEPKKAVPTTIANPYIRLKRAPEATITPQVQTTPKIKTRPPLTATLIFPMNKTLQRQCTDPATNPRLKSHSRLSDF